MKKLLVSLFALFAFTFSYAQETFGRYHCSYYDCDLEILASANDADYDIYLEVFGTCGDTMSGTTFQIEGNENIRQFIDALESMKKQFIEWSSEQNGRKGYEKRFDVNLPYFKVLWHYSSLHYDYHPTPKARFVVPDSGQCTAVISGEATASDNESLKNKYFFILSSVSDFDKLISSIQIDKLDEYFYPELYDWW